MKTISQCKYWWFALFIIYSSLPAFSQQKEKLHCEDYKLWNTLQIGSASDNGIWTSYSKSYRTGKDSLYLKNVDTGIQRVFTGGHSAKITPDGRLFGYLKNDSLFVMETATNAVKIYENISQFDFVKNSEYVVYCTEHNNTRKLTIENIKSGRTKYFDCVQAYSINNIQSYLAVTQKCGDDSFVRFVSLQSQYREFILSNSNTEDFNNLTWNSTGEAVAYYSSNRVQNIHTIIHASRLGGRPVVTKLDTLLLKKPKSYCIRKYKLYISDTGDKVFFDITEDNKAKEGNSVPLVWKSSDNQVPPKTGDNSMHWNVWFPQQNKVLEIEDGNLTACALTDGENKVILLDNTQYLPLYRYNDRYCDVYILDLKTGEKKKIITKQLNVYRHLVADSESKYIAYFRGQNWWSYNMQTGEHTCVTEHLNASFNKSNSDRLDQHQAHGFGGWTSTGQMILYDEFDIWIISPKGKNGQRITSGNSKKKYRIYEDLSLSLRDGFFRYASRIYDLKDGLLITELNATDLSEGFGIYYPSQGLQQITERKSKINYIKRFKKQNRFYFIESSFSIAPQLITTSTKGEIKILAKSNEQQNKFHWGHSEIVHYLSPEGKELIGALFYPANYSADKKYPMIVSIYENRSHALHEYVAPSLETFDGFNITNYTLEGYFVLLPDISYVIGKPGHSALHCVLAAVDETIKTNVIDEDNIGLIGHSFGGFETTYIISQTNRFKTAVAGAGVTDLLSFYLDIDSSSLSNMERFENSQFRNKIPFTEDKFLLESPIMNVKTINTPLLLWTGDSDKMVDPSYSIKMYAALWRLQKKSTLLTYPQEEHVLINPANQQNLTTKIMNWFDHYLKGAPKETWINN